MIKHVVCHRYRDKAEAYKIAPMLIATFDDRAGLDEYATHPEHVKVKEYIHSVLESSVSVDFEC